MYEYIVKRQQDTKALKRRKQSLETMKAYPDQYQCRNCIHGLTGSCDDNLPDGCEHFRDIVRNRWFVGNRSAVAKSYRRAL